MDCAVLPLEAPLVIRAAGVRRGARGGAAFEAGELSPSGASSRPSPEPPFSGLSRELRF